MSRLAHLLRNLFQRGRVDRELDAELNTYLEQLAAEKQAAGMSPDQARRLARLELGGLEDVKERVRDVRSGAWLERVLRDVRFGLRTLGRTPAFTGFTVLTFALAIGGLTVIFSLVNAVLLRPLPYPDSNRLVMVMEVDAIRLVGGYAVAAPNYLDWERQNRVFERMALYEYQGFNLSGDGEPEQVGGLRATHGLFQVLRVVPVLGRGLVAEDDSGKDGRVVVLSFGLWQRRYGGDSAVVGRTIRVNSEPWLVIGVMPRGFAFPTAQQALWTNIGFNAEDRGRGSHSFWSVARLKPGVSVEQSLNEMRTIGARLAAQYPESNTNETVNVIPMRNLWIEGARDTLTALLVAVGLVLLIASANIASLLVARGNARRRELAARMALGGSKGRIISQLVTESVLLSLAGGAAGLVLALLGVRVLVDIFPPSVRFVPFRDLSTVSIDFKVFLVAVGVAIAAGIAAGLAPALTVLPADPAEVLRDSEGRGATARSGRRLKNALVSIEVALAVMVLVGAGLLITSIQKLHAVDPGLNPSNLVAMDMSLPQADFYGPPVRADFCNQEQLQVGQLPGVVATSAVSHLPLTGRSASRSFVIEGAADPGPSNLPWGQYGVVCPGYFQTMGIALGGRDFTLADRSDAPLVVIINQALRDRYFPHQDPVGRRFRLGRYDVDSPWLTIVGVAGNVRHNSLRSDIDPYLYVPYSQAVWPEMTIVVRTGGGTEALVTSVRQALARIEPDAPLDDPMTMQQVVNDSLGHVRFPMVLFTVFAALAVTLAATGIFGIASQLVQQRRRELGIRRALGARAGQLYGLVVGQTMTPVVAGIGLGVAGGLAGARALRSLLFGIGPTNLATFGVVSVALGIIALGACLVPARRAARVDPVTVLREE